MVMLAFELLLLWKLSSEFQESSLDTWEFSVTGHFGRKCFAPKELKLGENERLGMLEKGELASFIDQKIFGKRTWSKWCAGS